MSKFINPFSDYGFKTIFGQEVNKHILLEFLNDLFAGERVIDDLTFLDKERQPEIKNKRMFVYDIYCRTNTGEHIIVEMQQGTQAYFKNRALFYTASAIAAQGESGSGWQYNIDAVYGVFFLNFRLPDVGSKVRTDVVLVNRATGEIFSDKLRQVFISLPNFELKEDECTSNFERWIYVLKNMEILDRMPFAAQMKVMKELEEIIAVASMSPDKYDLYQASLKVYRDNLAGLEAQRREREEWKKEREEGKKEKAALRKEGAVLKKERAALKKEKAALKRELDQKLSEGRAEEKAATARNLKRLGVPLETILQATGLSPEEIEAL
jgi:predicted transposase/invertase (TIGR01784 family)